MVSDGQTLPDSFVMEAIGDRYSNTAMRTGTARMGQTLAGE